MDRLLDKDKFKRSFKNICRIWGLIILFLTFHICIREGLRQDLPILFLGAAIFLAFTILLAENIRRRLNRYDDCCKPPLTTTPED